MERFCEEVDNSTYPVYIAEIMKTFKAIADRKLPDDIQLLNYYKGIPVSYEARVIDVDKDKQSVFFEVHINQLVAAELEKKVLIKSSHFARDLIAEVNYVRAQRRELALRNFVYVDIASDRRSFVRVDLAHPVNITVRIGQKKIEGTAVDMSVASIAAHLESNDLQEVKGRFPLSVRLPDLQTGAAYMLEIEGELIRVETKEGRLHYVLKLIPDKKAETLLAQFIVQRQIEIVRELKELYLDMA